MDRLKLIYVGVCLLFLIFLQLLAVPTEAGVDAYNVNCLSNSFSVGSEAGVGNDFYLYIPVRGIPSQTWDCSPIGKWHSTTLSDQISVYSYPIRYKYFFQAYNHDDNYYKHDSDPGLKVILCNPDGTIYGDYIVDLSFHNDSATGSFQIPAGKGAMVRLQTGYWVGGWILNQLGRGYRCKCSLTYQLDETPPVTPDAPWVDSTQPGMLENGVFYTNLHSVSFGWNSVVDQGTPFETWVTKSGFKEYIFEKNSQSSAPDDSNWSPLDSTSQTSYTANSIPQGMNYFRVIARDMEDNDSNPSPVMAVMVDNTPPNLTAPVLFPSPENQVFTSARSLSWRWNAEDIHSGVTQYYVIVTDNPNFEPVINDPNWVDNSTSNVFTKDTPVDGESYRCWVKAVDWVGNCRIRGSQAIKMDYQGPQGSLEDYPVKFDGQSKTAEFRWNPMTDTGVGLSYTNPYEVTITTDHVTPVSGIPTNLCAHTFSLESLTQTYFAWVRGNDALGNKGDWLCAGPFPEFQVTGPVDQLVTNVAQSFEITRINPMGGDQFKYQLCHQSTAQPGAVTFDFTQTGPTPPYVFPDGEWEWWFNIFAVSGEGGGLNLIQSTEKRTLKVDTKPPTGSFFVTSKDGAKTFSESNSSNTREVLVSVDKTSLTDTGVAGVKGIYLWNGEGKQPPPESIYLTTAEIPSAGIPWELTAGPDGLRTVTMQIMDLAGNFRNVPYTVALDTTAPAMPGNFSHTQVPAGDLLRFNWKTANPGHDLEKFAGKYLFPDGREIALDNLTPIAGEGDLALGGYDINLMGIGPNQPITLQIYSVDKAGNESAPATYTAYTPAALGTLQSLPGDENDLKNHTLKWRLDQNPGANGNILEYGEMTPAGFVVSGTLQPDSNGIFTHTGLTPHGIYDYRLMAFNGSNPPDRTEGEIFKRQVANVTPTSPEALAPVDFAGGTVKFQYRGALDDDGDLLNHQIFLREGSLSGFTEVPAELNNLSHGVTYYWYVAAGDGHGGTNFSRTMRFTVDRNAPVLTAERPGGIYTNQRQLLISAGDDLSGLDKVTYQDLSAETGQVIAEGETSLTRDLSGKLTGAIPLYEGFYHLKITARDQAGNETALDLNNLKVDQTFPDLFNLRLNLAQAGGRYLAGKSQAGAEWDAVDGFSGIKSLQYRLMDRQGNQRGNSGSVALTPNLQHFAYTLDLPGADGQEYYLVGSVLDQAGNSSPTMNLGPILFDRTPPVVNLSLVGLKAYGSSYYTSNLNDLAVNTFVNDPETGVTSPEFALFTEKSNNGAGWTSWAEAQKALLIPGKKYRVVMRAANLLGSAAETQSEEFLFDNTAPQNLILTGPTGYLESGEQAVFSISAQETESAVKQYRLAIGSNHGETGLTALIPGNQGGWLVFPSASTTQFRIELPVAADGMYYPTLEVVNAVGLKSSTSGAGFFLNNTQERVIAGDQGPYTMFHDRLTGWWRYTGEKPVTGYRYRILGPESQIVTDWQETTETMLTVTCLNLLNGQEYYFTVLAKLADGTETAAGVSPGVTVDTTAPRITGLQTPRVTTSRDLSFGWTGEDGESSITRVQVALGSDFYGFDLTGGWVDVTGSPARVSCKANGEKIELQTGKRYYLTLRITNGAGLITDETAPGIIIDDTPPLEPVVTDQGAYINLTQPLEANWIWSPGDPESGVTYQWALVESQAEITSDTLWHDGDISKRISLNTADFPRAHGHTYYFAVKAINEAGLTSVGFSNGIMVDATAPLIPRVTLLQAVGLGGRKEVTYITNTNDLQLWIDSLDPESGIDGYQYAFGTGEQVDQAPETYTNEATTTLNDPPLNEGELNIFKGECFNGAEQQSQTGYSVGVKLDTGAPVIKNVHAALAGCSLLFDWEAGPSISPVAWYEVALVEESRVNETPVSWNKVGLERSALVDGQGLSDGHYRLLVRGCNEAGTYSRRQGDLNEWGTSPRVTLDHQAPVLKPDQFNYEKYAASQLKVQIAALDNLSGIGGYQYALGSRNNPLEYTGGWVDLNEKTGWTEFSVPTGNVVHNAQVYLMVRAKDNAGQWSEPLVSQGVLIDHTLPAIPEVTCQAYANSRREIPGISFVSGDPESGVTHYSLGVVENKGDPWLVTQEGKVAEFDGKLAGLNLEESKTYYLALKTRNGAGEWSEAGYSSLITVDTVPPALVFAKKDLTVVLNQPPVDVEYTLSENAGVEFTLTAGDGTAKTLTVAGQAGLSSFVFNEAKPDTYRLTAQVTDPAGNRGPEEVQVIRVNAPPLISLPAEIKTTPGAPVRFAGVVVDPDGAGGLLEYRWETGEPGGPVLTGEVSEYRYTSLGEYTLSLTVTDPDGGVAVGSTRVKVGNTTQGSLYMDEVWSGVHRIYGDVTVPSGINLTILPGTQVIVDGTPENGYFHGLKVKGSLVAQGEEPAVSFSSVTGQAGGWKGIYVEGRAELSVVTVRDAMRGVLVMGTGNVMVSNCCFLGNRVGVHTFQAKPVVSNCVFQENTVYGIKEDQGGRPVVVNCRFVGNGIDYYHETLTDITMEQLNGIEGNYGNN